MSTFWLDTGEDDAKATKECRWLTKAGDGGSSDMFLGGVSIGQWQKRLCRRQFEELRSKPRTNISKQSLDFIL